LKEFSAAQNSGLGDFPGPAQKACSLQFQCGNGSVAPGSKSVKQTAAPPNKSKKWPVILFLKCTRPQKTMRIRWHKRTIYCVFLSIALLATCRRTTAQVQPIASQNNSGTLEEHLGKGYDALKQEKYPDAETEFRAALAIDPTLTLRARFPLAVALFEQHKSAQSRREFEAVHRDAGDQPGVSYYLGRLDLDDRNYKGAIESLSKAGEHPPFPDTAFYLGLAYMKQGSDEQAEKWLKKATEVNPDDSRAEYQLALLYRKEGRQDEANQAFQRSKDNKAKSDKLSQWRYACAQELDRDAAAPAPSCEQLYDANDADRLTSLGILYGQHGQLERALTLLHRAAELAPQSPQTQYNLAFTYFQSKRFADARASLETAVRRWPDLFPLNSLYGAVLWNLGEVEPAYEALHHAHQLNAQDASTAALLGQSLLELARHADDAAALQYLQEATTVAPGDPEPHRRMSQIYQHMGKPGLAREEAQKAEALANSARH
jgi:tetratricopeptide (TPR) repeat protein